MAKKTYYIFFISFIIFFGLFRFFNFIESPVPLGYDPGIYRHMFIEYFTLTPHVDYSKLTPYNFSGFPPLIGHIGIVLQSIGFSVDTLITFGIGFFSLITTLFIYLFLKPYNKTVAVYGAILFSISIIQYQAYWWGYYKQILAIIFMLVSLRLIKDKQIFLAVICSIATLTIHRPTGLYFAIVMIVYFGICLISKKGIDLKKLIAFGIFTGIGTIIVYFKFLEVLILPMISPIFTTVSSGQSSGTFLNQDAFGQLNFFIILLSVYGLYKKLSLREFDIPVIGYFIGMIWIGANLFFYNRLLIVFDIFIIILAAYGLYYIWISKHKYIPYLVPVIILLQVVKFTIHVTTNHEALISASEFQAIQGLHKIVEENAKILVSDKSYSPWLHGYTSQEVIAPGLFHNNKWNKKDWGTWWYAGEAEKCKLIQDYKPEDDTPVYWWVGERQKNPNITGGECFKEVSSGDTYKVYKIIF